MDSSEMSQSGEFGQLVDSYRYEYQYESEAEMSHLDVHITEAIATAAGVDATDLQRPLWEVINIDALMELFEAGQTGTVSFDYSDFRVRVEVVAEGTGTITVTRTAQAAD